jgi:hypothetical protein
VLAPIAATHPTLLLVMDGLSVSIFRELFARGARHGWAELMPSDLGRPLVGVAALPTVTEVSRASLLGGRLALGAAAHEKAGFAAHAALLAHSRAGAPPRLFHKGDLADATNLAPALRAAIADPHQRVIGVVYNAVDDHLSGPDQLHQRWMLEDLRLLSPLLREAREARRVVVITADHGHLLEDGTTQIDGGGESDRWRPGTDRRSPHEVVVSGGRVVTRDGSNAVVCLWGESTRYGRPQERLPRWPVASGGDGPAERDGALGNESDRVDARAARATRVVGSAADPESAGGEAGDRPTDATRRPQAD